MEKDLILPLIGFFLAIVFLVFSIAGVFSGIKEEDRSYADPLPVFLRLTWPIIRCFEPVALRLLSPPARERLRSRLVSADWDRVLKPEQFLSAQILSGIFSSCLIALYFGFSTLSVVACFCGAAVGFSLPRRMLSNRIKRRQRRLLARLPNDLDLIILSIGSGLNLSAALSLTAAHSPPGPLKEEWTKILRDIHAGQVRQEALRQFAQRVKLPAVASLVSVLLSTERQGASLIPALRIQAEQRRNEHFLRAEKLAMEAPVKIIFPLLVFVFPGAFVVMFFPVVMRFIQEGIL